MKSFKVNMSIQNDIPTIVDVESIGKIAHEHEVIFHAHSDHVDYATFLHKDIPLYVGKTTKGILQALFEIQGR